MAGVMGKNQPRNLQAQLARDAAIPLDQTPDRPSREDGRNAPAMPYRGEQCPVRMCHFRSDHSPMALEIATLCALF